MIDAAKVRVQCGQGVAVTNLNVISMFTVAERKSENSKLITWGGWLAGGGTERIFFSLTLIDLLRSDSL